MTKRVAFVSLVAVLLLMIGCTSEIDMTNQQLAEKPETVNGIIPMSYARQRLAAIVGELNAQISDEANRIPANTAAILSV